MSSGKIKALWLTNWWPRPDHPVLGIFTQREAKAVATICDLVVIHVQERESRGKVIIEDRISEDDYRELIVYYPKANGVLSPIRKIRSWWMALQYVESQGFKPNVVHLHVMSFVGLAALYFCKKKRLPLFISEHWSGFSLPKPPLGYMRTWIFKRLATAAEAVFVVTSNMAASMRKLGIEGHFIVNPNLVETDFFSPSETPLPYQPFRFIHISNLDDSHKNISGLVRAYAKIAHRKNVILTIIGGDEGTAHVEALVESLKVSRKVRLLGVQNATILRQELRQSHAFVLFSNREGLPCVLLEAMAVGIPIISSDIPGLEDWVTQETGVLVPRHNETALVEAMLNLIENYEAFDKQKIREKIVRNCSPEVVGSRILNAYEAVLAAAKNRS